METKESDGNSPSEPVAPQPILLIWIGSKDRIPEPAQRQFWTNWSQENQQEVEQRLLIDSPPASEFLSEPLFEKVPAAEDESISVSVIRAAHWGHSLQALAKERPWKSIVILPSWQNPQDLSRDLSDYLGSTDLDGVTFCREGTQAPFPIWLWRGLVTRPICFLLEIPWASEPDWLGWRNWFWEITGSWLFGVKNRDPLFPCRAFHGPLFRQLALQSGSGWVWMEILAKLHFLGARLSERRLPPPGKELGAPAGKKMAQWGHAVEWADMSQVFRKPEFVPPSDV